MFELSLTGTVGNTPELKLTDSGIAFYKVSVAVRGWDGKQETTTWVSCTAWDKLAERLDKIEIRKGDFFVCSGRLRARAYADKSGTLQASIELTIRDFDFKRKIVQTAPTEGDVFKPDWDNEETAAHE